MYTDYPLTDFTVHILWANGAGWAPEAFFEDMEMVRMSEGGVLAFRFPGNVWRLASPSAWSEVAVSPRGRDGSS